VVWIACTVNENDFTYSDKTLDWLASSNIAKAQRRTMTNNTVVYSAAICPGMRNACVSWLVTPRRADYQNLTIALV